MSVIGLDTSHKFLIITLLDDTRVIDSIMMDCFKQQSEYIVQKMDELLSANHQTLEDVKALVTTIGPGSYTGVRIALTVCKVLGSISHKPVYTLSSLQFYAGQHDCLVAIDARAKRCYVGRYRNGEALWPDRVLANEEIAQLLREEKPELIGDGELFGLPNNYPQLAKHFLDLKKQWQPVENIDILTPVYLKSETEYLKK